MKKKSTTINEAARQALRITRDDYALCSYVQYRQADRRGKAGWCVDPKQEIADFIGITRPGLYKMIDRLCGENLLFVDPANGAIQVTEKWIDAESECKQSLQPSVNKVYSECKQSLQPSVNKVTHNIEVEYEYKVKESESEVKQNSHAPAQKSADLKAEIPKTPPTPVPPPPSHAPRGWMPVDPVAEIETMRADDLCKERFVRVERLPLEKYGAMLDNFLLKVKSEQQNHNNRTDFRNHFFSWARLSAGHSGPAYIGAGQAGTPVGPTYAKLKTYGS